VSNAKKTIIAGTPAPEAHNNTALMESLLNSCKLSRNSDHATWEKNVNQLRALIKPATPRTLKARIYLETANLWAIAKGDFKVSLEFCSAALLLIDSDRDPNIADYHTLCGVNYFYLGEYHNAQTHYLQSIEVLEARNDHTAESIETIAKQYYNLGLLHTNLADKHSSVGHLMNALDLFSKIGSKAGMARCYNALGHHHPDSAVNYEISINYYLKASDKFEQLNDLVGLSSAYCNIGNKYAQKKNLEQSLHYLNKGLQIRLQLGNPSSIAYTYMFIGRAYFTHGHLEKAIEFFLESEKLFIETNTGHDLHQLYEEIANCYANLNQYDQAYSYRLKYMERKGNVNNFDYATTLSMQQIKYVLEQQEKLAALELQKREDLAQYITQLELVHEELKQMAYIACHDLREPVRLISNYAAKLSALYPPTEEFEIPLLFMTDIKKISKNMWGIIKSLDEFTKAVA
jgi:tetratricopeptide (TPR) repeat protein